MSLQNRMRSMALDRAAVKPVVDDQACNRRSKRKSTSLASMITFTGMRTSIACTVEDMSLSGAKIAFSKALLDTMGDMEHLPDRLVLVLRADRMQVQCEVKWRRAGKIGLRFLGPPMPIAARR